MKKARILFLILAVAVLLCACKEPQTVFQVEKNGISFTVDTESRTISDGTNTYHYLNVRSSANQWKKTTTLIYPNGATYERVTEDSGNTSISGDNWSVTYDDSLYVPGEVLLEVMEEAEKQIDRSPRPVPGMIGAGILLAGLGILDAIFPCFLWELRYGLYFQDAAPTDFAVAMNRLAGIIIAVAGVIIVIIGMKGVRV